MKKYLPIFIWMCIVVKNFSQNVSSSPNIILITSDGLRWQEVFKGFDAKIGWNIDNETILKYQSYSADSSRQKLMPFFWNTLVPNGNLYGNRSYKNTINTKNYHRFSYPGYSELLCGYFDPSVNSNKKTYNKNVSVLETLNSSNQYSGKVAVFSSWEVFPYILNEPRSKIYVNAGWEKITEGNLNEKILKLNKGNENPPLWKGETRYDDLTWNMAIEYIKANHPKIMMISLDDTDASGHKGAYKSYLNAINQLDQYLSEIWHLIQTDPFYNGKTYLLITTDHGRGSTKKTWMKHGLLPASSGEIWLYEFGPTLKPHGELVCKSKDYQASIAHKIMAYSNDHIRASQLPENTGPIALSSSFQNGLGKISIKER